MAIQRLTMVVSMVVVEAILLIVIAAGGAGSSTGFEHGPQAGSPIPVPSGIDR